MNASRAAGMFLVTALFACSASPRLLLRKAPPKKSDVTKVDATTVPVRGAEAVAVYEFEVPAPYMGGEPNTEAEPKAFYGSVKGELLSVDDDYVCLANSAVICLPTVVLTELEVEVRESSTGATVGLSLLGALSTVTHGWYAGLTLPLWALVGAASTAIEASDTSLRIGPDHLWLAFQFARYPQGYPPSIRPRLKSVVPEAMVAAGLLTTWTEPTPDPLPRLRKFEASEWVEVSGGDGGGFGESAEEGHSEDDRNDGTGVD